MQEKQKKIVIAIERMANTSGGAQKVVSELANYLSDKNHDVFIWTYDTKKGGSYFPLNSSVQYENLFLMNSTLEKTKSWIEKITGFILNKTAPDILGPWKYKTRYSRWSKIISKKSKTLKPDVIIAIMPPAIAAVGRAETSQTIKKVASNHSSPLEEYYNKNRWDKGKYARKQRIKDLEKFSEITVLLPEFQDWYKDNLNIRTTVIPNVLEPTLDENKGGKHLSKKIIGVGRIIDSKGYDLLIKSWSKLHKSYPEWSLEIYGEGNKKEELQKMARNLGIENDIFKGRKSDMIAVYKNASILAHPSHFEGFGLVVGEALSAGVPVVGNIDCPGVNTLIQNGENGKLVSFEKGEEEFTTALETLMKDEQKHNTMSKNGPSSIEKFSKENIIQSWEKVLF
jgi:glycosyltransferase involved in cell wall biosynthesis